MTLALIDGDQIAYQAAFAVQEVYDWGDTGGKVSIADPNEAAKAATSLVQAWADKVGATEIIVGLTGKDKFRKRLLPSYQSNRINAVKPGGHAEAVQAMKDSFPFHLIEGLEADDVLGILMTSRKYRDRAVIVSQDKDFKTIPGRFFNPEKMAFPEEITLAQADWFWAYQTLIGDTSDGYKGCPGIGEVKAKAILGKPDTWATMKSYWPKVVQAYYSKGRTEEDALVQARMARILRREDYDTPNKRITLWHPTTTVVIPLLADTASTVTDTAATGATTPLTPSTSTPVSLPPSNGTSTPV